MTIGELITLLENQIATLNGARTTADRSGDIEQALLIDAKIAETTATVAALKEI